MKSVDKLKIANFYLTDSKKCSLCRCLPLSLALSRRGLAIVKVGGRIGKEIGHKQKSNGKGKDTIHKNRGQRE
jgi:hypothetical protein